MTLPRRPAWWTVLAVCLSLLLCAVLYQQTRSLDLRAHDALKESLERVEQLDADLGKGVLASRYGLVNQYDALTQSDAAVDANRVELRVLLNGAIDHEQSTEQAVSRLEQAERALTSDVELFKTQNSVLKNSLFYLPAAGEAFSASLHTAGAPDSTRLEGEAQALVHSTLVYNLLRTSSLRDALRVQREELTAKAERLPEPLRPKLLQLLRHAETVVRQEDVVDPLVARISSSTVSQAASDLEVLNDQDLEVDEARVNRYRDALIVLVALLLVALSVIGVKLTRLYATLEQQVLERTQKLGEEKLALQVAERAARLNEARITAIIEGAREGIVRLDSNGLIRSWNPAAAQMFEAPGALSEGKSFVTTAVLPEASHAFVAWLSRADTSGRIDQADYWHELPFISATNRVFSAECSVARRDPDTDTELTLFVRDISQAKQLEAELRQAQKLESVGRLASGIAHEINTPIQFVSDSCFFVKEAFTALFRLVHGYANLLARDALAPELLRTAKALEEEADLDYLRASIPKSIETMSDGLARVAELVAGMKTFAHPDQKEKVMVDLNHALKSTLTIARNEYKYIADLETDLVELPSVLCHAGGINQVVLNIIVNAAHAIADQLTGGEQRGRIVLRTRFEGDCVLISVSDSGSGIPPEVQGRIFEPFFTTKEVGKGTGQGLAIARAVVVEKHGGQLSFETEPGKGTTFHIRLPINASSSEARSAA